MPRPLAPLVARALHVRDLYAKLETQRNGRPWKRAELAQGFVGDVGALMKLLMAKDGLRSIDRLDERLRHEFGDCLWSILVLAEAYGVDLEAAFQQTMDELEARFKPKPKPAKSRRQQPRSKRVIRG